MQCGVIVVLFSFGVITTQATTYLYTPADRTYTIKKPIIIALQYVRRHATSLTHTEVTIDFHTPTDIYRLCPRATLAVSAEGVRRGVVYNFGLVCLSVRR